LIGKRGGPVYRNPKLSRGIGFALLLTAFVGAIAWVVWLHIELYVMTDVSYPVTERTLTGGFVLDGNEEETSPIREITNTEGTLRTAQEVMENLKDGDIIFRRSDSTYLRYNANEGWQKIEVIEYNSSGISLSMRVKK